MSFWQSYRNLSPRTRMIAGGGVIVWGIVGILISDRAEKSFDLVPTDEDRRKLKEAIPKLHMVEKEK
ncbi:unnamed protein product [Zymoseptoria tritici ST99CH_3D1]|uniref:Uncharacterized protein n=2 Tax=Zymoseptoria tritici TaxID=1047171 RepID=A0A1X7RSC8_ZYMT9|nr:unnamed protein product [Zymoseptoria tritici ST99CH_3D7]SMR51284.1 unnamed protein product [Zymoseptoria tritici ST99CH_1E4]SMR52376.1 unnamed protein product [Zymoseptoria tritici ST99CH_3D1]